MAARRDTRPGLSPFPPIGDYAFLSDCETGALVAGNGAVEWMCVPAFDSPSVFGAMLDRDAGSFRVGPVDQEVPAARRYLPGTMVLETTWATRSGWLVVRDVLLVGPWNDTQERSRTHRRVPTDADADHVLVRIMRCVDGAVDVVVECEPFFDYGRRAASWRYAGQGYEVAVADGGESLPPLTLGGDIRLGFEGGRARGLTTLQDGEVRFVALSFSSHGGPRTAQEAHERLTATAGFWHRWLGRGRFPDHPWKAHLQRSALTLKGLSFAPTGALLAAPTTSLPETPGGGRNWDYRYCWVRDATFMLWALHSLGFDWEAGEYYYFIEELARSGDLQIVYGIRGERQLEELELNHLSGYEGARPVRIGNAAYRQRQHDVWGAMLDSVFLHTKAREHIPDRRWPLICALVEAAVEHWREPDHGLWEVRGGPRHFVSSKVMCWVACDRGARLARLRGDRQAEARWLAEAAAIRNDVLERGVREDGALRQHYDSDALDASALLAPLVRFLPADDPRVRATIEAIGRELCTDGLVRRYDETCTDDGQDAAPEGAFAICSFWMISALSEIGEHDRAHDLCEKLLSLASPLQLYGEEIDPRSGRHLGNFPQAFTHLALINAVMHVIRADERLGASQQRLTAQDVALGRSA
jgi:GH15 family glucan-1,4-alpha-glucosidase